MPAVGMAAKMAFQPNGLNPPPPGLKLPPWNLVNKMMMVRTGIATFHHVMTLLTWANSRTARKLIAVKVAISRIVHRKPLVVETPFSELYRPGQ